MVSWVYGLILLIVGIALIALRNVIGDTTIATLMYIVGIILALVGVIFLILGLVGMGGLDLDFILPITQTIK